MNRIDRSIDRDLTGIDMHPLVMIPGLGSDAAVWQPTINQLAPDIECHVGDTLSDDSLSGMAERILKSAPPRFALAGVSMGGMVALEIMRAAPWRVSALVLCDTNANHDTDAQSERRRATNAAMLETTDLAGLAAPAIAYMVHPQASQEVRDALLQMTLRVGVDIYVKQNLALMERYDLRRILPTITVPTIVIVGAEDQMTPPSLSKEICKKIRGASLHVLPNCGHLPPIEKPHSVAALIREALVK